MSGTASPTPTLAQRVLEWSRPVIGIFALGIFLAAFVLAAVKNNMSVLSVLVGSIQLAFGTVIGYYFGSSSGSEKKDTAMLAAVSTLTAAGGLPGVTGAPGPTSPTRAPTDVGH